MQMKITWLGTASILVSSGSDRILFDPYLKLLNPRLPPFPLEDIADVKAILITHPHLDHFADMPAVMEKCAAPVYVCDRGIEIAEEQGFNLSRMISISPGDEVSVGSMKIRVYQSCHCMYDRPVVRETLSRALRPAHLREGLSIDVQNHRFRIDMNRDVYGYEIRDDHRSIFLMGSANCCENVAYPKEMDLLVYPYQGRSDMADYSMQFLDRFRPRRVMLDHFDDAFPPVSAQMDYAPFLEKAARRYPEMEIFAPREMEVYNV